MKKDDIDGPLYLQLKFVEQNNWKHQNSKR